MTEEFMFDLAPWEATLQGKHRGDTIQLLDWLTLLEAEPEDVAQDALDALEAEGIALDLTGLPHEAASGAAGERLAWEMKLARQEDWLSNLPENDPLALYLQELAARPATGNVEGYLQHYREGDQAAAEQLANEMLSLVVAESRKCTGYGVLLLDLIQEGSLGLWQGILQYESGDFTGHCLWYIRQYLAKVVFWQLRSSGLGSKLRQGMEDYLAADQQLLTSLGRNPTLEEIADFLHLTPEQTATYEKMLSDAKLRQKIQNREKPREEPDDEQAVENTAYFQSRQRIAEMLSTLEPKEAELLSLRFGLEGGTPLSPQEVGHRLNLTAEQAVALEGAALQKLRENQ